jgi:ATP-binding cassette subfamily B multidrug efflux pump
VTSAAQRYLIGRSGQGMLASLRGQLFRHLQELPLGYHETHIVGVTISRVINDVDVINDFLSSGVVTLIGDLLVLAGIIFVMLSMSPILALLTFSVLPLMVLATILFARRAQTAYRTTRARIARVVGNLAEDISGMRVIQAFAQEGTTGERFDEVNRANRDANVAAMSLSFAFLPGVEFLSMLATGIVLLFGGIGVARGMLTLGVVVAFLSYVTRFFQPIRELSQVYTTMQSAIAGGERVLALLDAPVGVADRPDALEMPSIAGRVELEDVSFAYHSSSEARQTLSHQPQQTDAVSCQQPGTSCVEPSEASPPERVLHHVNLLVEPGQRVALVGPTGAGKTSIANLIARFYDVNEGAVLVDGIDVRDVTQHSLRRQLGLVPQDPFLFSGTIADNIRFGRPDTPQSAVEEAARMANAHGFIMAMPDGYNTVVMEGAVNLSVGQRQLICIARAVLADPRILILDEATSSVDTVTEVLIQEALVRLMRGRTAVVIAHRLSTVRDADLVCVMNDGRIIERGRHEELLARGGLYRELYEQSGHAG